MNATRPTSQKAVEDRPRRQASAVRLDPTIPPFPDRVFHRDDRSYTPPHGDPLMSRRRLRRARKP